MAGKVQNYVHSKNAPSADSRQGPAPGGKAGWDELKMAPPKSNSRQTRSQNQHAKQPAQAKTEQKPANGHQLSRRQSNEERHFYDTDVSDVDQNSTTASANQSNAGAARFQSVHAPANGHIDGNQRSSSSGGGDEDGEEHSSEFESEEDLPEDPITGDLGPKLMKKMNDVDAALKNPQPGMSLPTVKGDSYPSTTSGRPSDAGTDTPYDSRSTAHQQRVQAPAQAPLPTRGGSQRQPLAPAAAQNHLQGQPRQGAVPSDQRSAQPNFLSRQAGGADPIADIISTGFQFGKAGKQQVAAQLPVHSRQQNASGGKTSKQTISNNTAQRASAPTANESSHHVPHQQLNTETARGGALSPENPQLAKQRRKSRNLTPVQQQPIMGAPQFEQLSDADVEANGNMPDGAYAGEQQSESQPQMDYEAAELQRMDYQDLRKQSFDIDPNAETFRLPADQQNDSLNNKLATVAVLQPQDQAHFFASLPLDEWEQAGEWFLGRFSDVVGKLRDARQEKRKAARSFEDEIESRYKAVGKKRKHIEESLTEMKESGGKVLEGTPKKTRTK